jgi:hypothetical protein
VPSSDAIDSIQRLADALQEDIKELESLRLDFQASAKGKKDASGRLNISKFKWMRHQGRIEKLRERISGKRAGLANAMALLQK